MVCSTFIDVWNQSKYINTRTNIMTKCQELLVCILKKIDQKQAAQIQNFSLDRFFFLWYLKYIKENYVQTSA